MFEIIIKFWLMSFTKLSKCVVSFFDKFPNFQRLYNVENIISCNMCFYKDIHLILEKIIYYLACHNIIIRPSYCFKQVVGHI